MGESEGEEDCVFLGTPFTSDEEEGVFQTRSRKVDPRNLPVRDQQGRVRFHGAFTGGFSAGYFNTVGTKEGWTPATFRSSRAEKNEGLKSGDGGQRPEDFMDEEDLGEFGIAPKQLVATQDFSLGKTSTTAPKLGKAIGGEVPADLIAPAPDPIGVRLLQNMGWRPGQGVGPRLTAAQLKKRRKRKRMARGGEGGAGERGVGGEGDDADDEEGEDDAELAKHTFAPRYVETVEYKPKNDVFGIGYSALANPTALLFAPQDRQAASRLNMSDVIAGRQQQSRTARRGLSGMVEDDDDIYDGDNMGNYDRVLGASDRIVKEAMKHPSLEPPVPDKMEICSDGRPVIAGFSLATQPTEIGKWFPAPTVPQGWKPFQDVDQQVPEARKDPAAAKNFTAAERGAMIGEDQSDRSVFAFLGPKDRERIMAAASQAKGDTPGLQFQQRTPLTGANASALAGAKRHEPPPAPKLHDSGDWVKSALDRLISEAKTKAAFVQESGKLNMQGPKPPPAPATRAPDGPTDLHPKFKEQHLACTVASAALRGNFKPFPNNAAKQTRYETFLKIQVDLGATEPDAGAKSQGGFFIDTKGGSGLTEWEAQQELEEFIKAAQMYRPMSAAIANRFVSAAARDEDTTAKIPPTVTADPDSEKRKAVAAKLFGKLTRTVEEWRPNRLLCKRMAVTDPYSGEGQAAVAAAGVKKPPPRELASLQFLPVPASVNVGGSEEQKTGNAATNEPKKGLEQEEQPPSRPPMDLFKAIFEDDDSDYSSRESETETEEEDGGKAQNGAETLAPPKPVDPLFAALAKNPTPIAPLPAHLSSQPAPVIPPIPQPNAPVAPHSRGGHIGVPIFAANTTAPAPIKSEKVDDAGTKSGVGLVMPTKKAEPVRVSGHGSDDEPVGPLWNVPPLPPAEKEERSGSPLFMLGTLKGLSERGIVVGPQPAPPSTNSNAAKQIQPIKAAQQGDSSDEWVSNDESGDSTKRKRKHKEKKAKRDSKDGKGGKKRKKDKSKEKKKRKRKESESSDSESSDEDERRKKKRRKKKEGKEKRSKERKSKKRKVSEGSDGSSSEGESTGVILKKLKSLSQVQKQSVVKTLKGDR